VFPSKLSCSESPRRRNRSIQDLPTAGVASPYFVSPKIEIARTDVPIRSGGNIIAEYQRLTGSAWLTLGRQLSHYGELQAGFRRGFGEFQLDVGDPLLPEPSFDIGELYGGIIIDTLNTPDFPTEGFVVATEFVSSVEDLGASDSFNQLKGKLGYPMTFGRDTVIPSLNYGASLDALPAERSFSTGGFFNLSGYEQNALAASDFYIGQIIYLHRFSEDHKMPFLNLDFFAGATVEFAHLQSDIPQYDDPGNIYAGSLFIGLDTPLVPTYFGIGVNDDDEASAYLALGRIGTSRR